MRFLWEISDRTKSMILATATPVQLHPIEAWDMLDILSRGSERVLGNAWSNWRRASEVIPIVMGEESISENVHDAWNWLRNPFPPANEHRSFQAIRRRLQMQESDFVIQGGDMVRRGELRLIIGTDAASEGLNLQRLGTLINLDLPWNPTRLEQRKGRIQRIGQIQDEIWILNLRYRDSVEDRVHELLSSRLEEIHGLFGQIPDVLQDAWVNIAIGEEERAKKLIDNIRPRHPFDERYSKVKNIDWESCSQILNETEKLLVLRTGW